MVIGWTEPAVFVVVFALTAAAENNHIALIEFYGYGPLDVMQLQTLPPYRAGGP